MREILEKFKTRRIAVIGDLMLDKSIYGDVLRISPEAPVQVVNVTKEEYRPGGSANVASNIAALSAKAVVIGVAGNDSACKILKGRLESMGIDTSGVFVDESRPTIQKVRILGQHQQLLRVDYEKNESIPKKIQQGILSYLKRIIRDIDAIVISDYNKGMVCEDFTSEILDICRKSRKVIVVDPKPSNKKFFNKVSLIAPNHKEASEMVGIEEKSDDDLIRIGKKLVKEINSNVLITRGEKGMSLFDKKGPITNIPTKAKEVYDVTGAGDTVCATLTLALACGCSLKNASILANHAAGIVVGKLGTSTISLDELKGCIQ